MSTLQDRLRERKVTLARMNENQAETIETAREAVREIQGIIKHCPLAL